MSSPPGPWRHAIIVAPLCCQSLVLAIDLLPFVSRGDVATHEHLGQLFIGCLDRSDNMLVLADTGLHPLR